MCLQISSNRFGWLRLLSPHPGAARCHYLPQGEGTSIMRLYRVERRSHCHRALRDSRSDTRTTQRVRFDTKRRAILPLPGGEGRGEGERSANSGVWCKSGVDCCYPIAGEGKGSATVSVAAGGVPPTESDGRIVHPWLNLFRTTREFGAVGDDQPEGFEVEPRVKHRWNTDLCGTPDPARSYLNKYLDRVLGLMASLAQLLSSQVKLRASI